MKTNCVWCGRELNLDQHLFSDFKGSIDCFSCSAAMEIQTMRGILIWGYPLSGMNPDFAARPSEHNLYAGQKKI